MRNYRRICWMGTDQGDAVRLDICPDCGAVVGNAKKHDCWHDEQRSEPSP